MAKTEREKMLAGELYNPADPELATARTRARQITRLFNATTDEDGRHALLRELMGRIGEELLIEPPFHCDYGCNIFLGERVYMNFGCVILDCAEVRIGSDVMLGPHVQLYAATHPLDPLERASLRELAKPITIGRNVWIGGGAIVLPGVTIGESSTVGAGSVVTADVPPNVVVAGNPARIIRQLNP